ncbi:MAG: hypothetical protein RR253_06385 [Oscillospiraceae bacterium]
MNEMGFKNWLNKQGYSGKVISDTVCRLKKIEQICFSSDIDDEFSLDNCEKLLSIFKNKGENEEMASLHCSSLPIGKYQLSTYKYAVSLYIKFASQSI